jgi:hypothetical protein
LSSQRVNPVVFTSALLVGAAALALWSDVRFPGLQPESVRARFVHAGLSTVAVLAIPVPSTPGAVQMAVLMGIFLPALVWAFVSAIWLLRSLQGVLLGG